MLLETITQFNWLDVFVIIILVRICYISLRTGLSVEIFKFLGTIIAVYLSLHYYTVFSDFLRGRSSAETVPLPFLDFLSFVVLAVLGYLIFTLFRIAFYRFIKMETTPYLNKIGGLILGIGRGILLTSLVTFALAISTLSYLKNSVKDSCSGINLVKVAPSTYNWLWNTVTSKFMIAEKFNKTILEIQEDLSEK